MCKKKLIISLAMLALLGLPSLALAHGGSYGSPFGINVGVGGIGASVSPRGVHAGVGNLIRAGVSPRGVGAGVGSIRAGVSPWRGVHANVGNIVRTGVSPYGGVRANVGNIVRTGVSPYGVRANVGSRPYYDDGYGYDDDSYGQPGNGGLVGGILRGVFGY